MGRILLAPNASDCWQLCLSLNVLLFTIVVVIEITGIKHQERSGALSSGLYGILLYLLTYMVEKGQEVEGSGSPPTDGKKKNLAAADIEWEASGIGPDDEDGDVVEGSGSSDDEVGGSGAAPPVRIPPVVTQQTTAATRTPYVDVHEVERRPVEEDVRIEEEPTTTRTTPRESYSEMTTPRTPPPTIFEEERHAPIDVLLKPGILAGQLSARSVLLCGLFFCSLHEGGEGISMQARRHHRFCFDSLDNAKCKLGTQLARITLPLHFVRVGVRLN
ncbi:unnamed protein product [Toxocara canis]|uniref:Transmembrane protein n=1 Tax=Toxocara canis TaxID=6265 RepID=A0A183URV0_TOXCA|nr:unnamed protein product [Toxocara canis]